MHGHTSPSRRIDAARGALVAGEAGLLAVNGYLLALALAATVGRRRQRTPHPSRPLPVVAVLVPAHDEEVVLPATLRSLSAVNYPPDRVSITVVADNCTDRTAEIARDHGVEVLERRAEEGRGKGHALAWSVPRLLARHTEAQALVVVDADCEVDPDLLAVLAGRLEGGADAVQADYVVGNPSASSASALRYAAFAVVNTLRPLGKQALGLSVGLFGSGMAFRRNVLERMPWAPPETLAEDNEYHLRLVEAGLTVRFAPETSVRSDMPTSVSASHQQQSRWEAGRVHLARLWTARLLRRGIRHRDASAVNAAFELVIPPQSVVASATVTGAVLGVALRARRPVALAACNAVAQFTVLLVALRVADAPPAVYRALSGAPWAVARTLLVWIRTLLGRGATEFVRTARESGSGQE